MTNSTPRAEPAPDKAEERSTRQCVGCRRREIPSRLIRFAVGPKSALVVDPYRRLPGRGAHACASPECIRTGLERGGFGRTLKEPVHGNAQELATSASSLLLEKALSVLGIGRRNGRTHYGMDDVQRTLSAQQAAFVLVAEDASDRTREEVAAPARLQGVPVLQGPSMTALGAALGRGEVAVAAMEPGPMAEDVVWLVQSSSRLKVPARERAKRPSPTVETGGGEA